MSILVAEGNKGLRELYQQILSDYPILARSNAVDAYNSFFQDTKNDKSIELLVTGFVFGDSRINGLELAELVRRCETNNSGIKVRRTPIILVSSNVEVAQKPNLGDYVTMLFGEPPNLKDFLRYVESLGLKKKQVYEQPRQYCQAQAW